MTTILRIRKEEELPAYVRLNAVRDLVVGRVNIALLLRKRGRSEDVPETREHLLWSYQAAVQRGYVETAQIAEILQKLGIPLPE